MNRRKVAIQIIVADVAELGKAGKSAIRAYVETRMSRETFNQAVAIGLKIYERGQRLSRNEERKGKSDDHW